MNENERLAAIEDIKALRARFARCMDTKQWVAMHDTISNDCVFDARMEGVVDDLWIGAEDIVANIRRNLETAVSVHHAHMPEIEITSPTTARALWSFNNRGALGHYQDEYALGDDGWRISAMTMTWIHPPSKRLLAERRGQFSPVADLWKTLAARFG